MKPTIQGTVIDCVDPEALAAFWSQILTVRWGVPFDGWAVVDADPHLIAFQRVPEPRPGPKNRLHLDLEVSDLDVAAAQAVELGARVVRPPEFLGDSGYVVMADPESNEFCFVTDPSGSFMATMRACMTRGGPAQPNRGSFGP
jgi:predicted enzyme related to lactoylglutathione lyase